MVSYTHDIIVIGAGSGGLNIAGFMNKAGFNVLLVDKTDKSIGGDCLNFGCVPSKALINTSHIINSAKQAQRFGLKISGTTDIKKIMKYVDNKKETIRKHENASYFRKNGMDVKLGLAKFTGKNSITIGNSKKQYQAKYIILATGARPRLLKLKGIEKVKYETNETIFNLKILPKKMLIVGAGPIGIELGQAFQRMGSQVTVIEKGEKFLPKEDPDIAKVLQDKIQKEGMKIHFHCETIEFTNKNTLKVRDTKTKKTLDFKFDTILVSIGRQLNIDNLNLKAANIQLDESKNRLKVDKYLRTTNKNIFVCGDVAGSYQFTHTAEMHAAVILRNFFTPRIFWKKMNYDKIAWVTYTDPEIATFGLNTEQLQKRKIQFEEMIHDFKTDDRAIATESTEGKVKLYISKKGRILGGTMIGKHAGELMQELILANSANLHIKHFMNKVYPYPTASRINKYTLRPYFARKLNNFSKKIIKLLY
ncbi:NAD(P)/FAD-dependent oxidoreductase [archaeon]|jgi:pyruvate/2-oxoglutarate dehydrogenase complex dihydrolipoamide dehydrogenase (E3) component|nr:NAD(P)/FAD-dependent oxidoreductase [archaeon]MBT6698548.1 NAD(P)/FAD-dependent oxidoreductase [archaeon]